jgi:flagellar protein FlaJ
MVEIPEPGYIKKLIITGKFPRFLVYLITIICISVFMLLAVLAFFNILGDASPVDFIIFAILSGTGIYGVYEYLHFKRIYKIDLVFPDFVRDLAASRRAGMTFTNAILFTSKGSYGLLTEEIKKIAQQISWGNSVEDALLSFAQRINTKSVLRTISLIIEASKSGGNVADVLDVAAEDAREIKLLEAERKVNMASYVIVIYVAMFVFMAIIAMLAGVFIPTITGAGSIELSNTIGGGGTMDGTAILQVFYFATIVQSIGCGIVAGIFEDGHFESSIKHIFILVFVSWIVFKYLV